MWCNYVSFIGNGKKDDSIEFCTFDFTFTKECICKAWCNIRFIPMNRKCLGHLKLQQELGVSGDDDYTKQ